MERGPQGNEGTGDEFDQAWGADHMGEVGSEHAADMAANIGLEIPVVRGLKVDDQSHEFTQGQRGGRRLR